MLQQTPSECTSQMVVVLLMNIVLQLNILLNHGPPAVKNRRKTPTAWRNPRVRCAVSVTDHIY
eukprot:2189175-Amphidinium_carterae.1